MISLTFTAPFFEGTTTTTLVPGLYDVALNGLGFLVDTGSDNTFKRSSIPLLRQQSDTSDRPGEGSLNPEELWRRTLGSWHHGAGQSHNDREGSDPFRFRASKGVDPWTEWQLSLLNDTARKLSSTATNLRLVTAGDYLYVADDAVLRYTTDLTTWTTVTGAPGSAILSLASDGYTVYIAYGTGGVYSTTRGAASMSVFNTQHAHLLAYQRDRLLGADGRTLFALPAGGVAPTFTFTPDNTDFRWAGFAEAPGWIYALGTSGDKTVIYRLTIKDDGTTLTVPVPAGPLPDGEIGRSIAGYLGYLLIGSDKGVRFANPDSNGDLNVGALTETRNPVWCFEGQDRFVWYGLSNYDSTSTGLGRLDLKTFVSNLAPASASDVMAAAQGSVRSVLTFAGKRVFTVSGVGVYSETSALVAAGSISTGYISYGLPDAKVAMFVDLHHAPLKGRITAALTADDGASSVLGASTVTNSTAPTAPLQAGQRRGALYELTVTLTSASTTAGPVLQRITMRANPAPQRASQWIVPLILKTTVVTRNGTDVTRDPTSDRRALEGMNRDGRVVTYQDGAAAYPVFLADFEWTPERWNGSDWDGVFTAKLKDAAI